MLSFLFLLLAASLPSFPGGVVGSYYRSTSSLWLLLRKWALGHALVAFGIDLQGFQSPSWDL